MLLILLLAEGDVPRASVPEFAPDDRFAVLVIEADGTRHDVHGCLALARVIGRWWTYRFDPERHPHAIRRYGVDVYPTYIVHRDGQEIWRTHDPITLAEGLAWQ